MCCDSWGRKESDTTERLNCTEEVDPKKYCCDMSNSILPMFSSKNFIVPCLTFRYLIYFDFIFLHDVRECSNNESVKLEMTKEKLQLVPQIYKGS